MPRTPSIPPTRKARKGTASADDRVAATGGSAVRGAFFSRGECVARRLGVSVDEVVAHIAATSLAESRWSACWIEDLVVAAACARGDQEAWSDLTLAHGWRLREAARDLVGASDSALLVARFFARLRRGEAESISHFDGRHSLSYWLGARFAIMIDGRLPRLDMSGGSRRLSLPSAAHHADERLAT